ncbi:MAG TPA: YceI family protein [Steroidobacteraceae bacterium]|nr:YceI family protein [Steroidobacteraceae bacterium]
MIRAAMILFASTGLFGLSAHAAAPRWHADATTGRLEFVGTQAGAEFTGEFGEFSADVRFAPDALDSSRFDVQIATGSVDTADAERDGIIRGPDLFAVERHPEARYVADRFERTDEGFRAVGQLTLRGTTRPVPIDFRFRRDGDSARLEGSARIERLDFGVGQGEWQDTQWVGNDVLIRFDLVLQPAGAP